MFLVPRVEPGSVHGGRSRVNRERTFRTTERENRRDKTGTWGRHRGVRVWAALTLTAAVTAVSAIAIADAQGRMSVPAHMVRFDKAKTSDQHGHRQRILRQQHESRRLFLAFRTHVEL